MWIDEIAYSRRKTQMEWKTKGWVNGPFDATTNPCLVCTPLPQLSKLTWSPTSLLISNLIHSLHLNQFGIKTLLTLSPKLLFSLHGFNLSSSSHLWLSSPVFWAWNVDLPHSFTLELCISLRFVHLHPDLISI